MTSTFETAWSDLDSIGRDRSGAGYRRFAWTDEDCLLREWFAHHAAARSLDLQVDRAGNQWAWSDDPDAAAAAGRPALVLGSHLDSVPGGGAFDGPLGVVSAFLALDELRAAGMLRGSRPIGIVNFADEEGARFGVACAGSRLITGQLDADRARALRDQDGVSLAEAVDRHGILAEHMGPDPEAIGRIGTYLELHIEQGRGLVHTGERVAIGSSIWPHGRWQFDFTGTADHAGTTRLADRRDPTLPYARTVLAARASAQRCGALATFGKVEVTPNGVNAIPSRVRSWLDVRAPSDSSVRSVVDELSDLARADGAVVSEESWTNETHFDARLRSRIAAVLPNAPILATGAGHDAGVLALAGVPTGMLFVRNPTGISHSPEEHAELDDCLAGIGALTAVAAELLQ